MASELVEFDDENKTLGITLNLEEDNVGAVILGDYTGIKEGMSVKSTGRIASIPVGENLIGTALAGGVICLLPVLVMYIIAQDKIIEGMASSGIKR